MTILDKIIEHKRKEVSDRKATISIDQLEQAPNYQLNRVSLSTKLKDPNESGIIAEFKRKSPSKGIINDQAEVTTTTIGYQEAGASGLSVLTDSIFFGGSAKDIEQIREQVQIPILRKDFIIDTYQIIEARAMGADVILLIAAVLTKKQLQELAAFAHSLQLEVLMEVHNQEELDRGLNPHIDLVGVNNRNLKDFTVDIQTAMGLASSIPDTFVKVAESGLSDPKEIKVLREYGYKGFLMGQRFMETAQPETACYAFIQSLQIPLKS